MQEDLLIREERLIVGLFVQPRSYPPSPFSRSQQLALLYGKISERYTYPTFNQLPGGAAMLQPSTQSHVQLQELLVQVNEAIDIHFDAAKSKAIDILEIIAEQFQITTFANLGVKLTARCPISGDRKAAGFLEDKYLKISETTFGILGPGKDGSGLRFHFNRGNSLYTLLIESNWQDPSRLLIDIDIQYPGAFSGLKDIGSRIQAVYNYLTSDVKKFLESAA